jgi:hypothetical protein
VFRCFPFLTVFKTFTVSVILSYVCPMFNICFEYPELLLLFLIDCMFSLYLVLNVQSVCPIYINGQSMHLIWYTPFFRTCLVYEVLLSFVRCFSSECDLNICFSEKFCDLFCFFSIIHEHSPFSHLMLLACIFVVCDFLNDLCLSYIM